MSKNNKKQTDIHIDDQSANVVNSNHQFSEAINQNLLVMDEHYLATASISNEPRLAEPKVDKPGHPEELVINPPGIDCDLPEPGRVFIGSSGDETLTGANRGDFHSSFLGNDILYGVSGSDTLTGGSGDDLFLFNFPGTNGDVSVITDFVSGVDRIMLSTEPEGVISPPYAYTMEFRESHRMELSSGEGLNKATGDKPQFIYNSSTGDLYFDGDGEGGKDAIHFATLEGNPALTADDVFGVYYYGSATNTGTNRGDFHVSGIDDYVLLNTEAEATDIYFM